MNRIDSYYSKLKIADNLFKGERITEMDDQFSMILADQSLSNYELADVQQYYTINNMIINADRDNRNVAKLLTTEINLLNSIAFKWQEI